MMRPIFVVMVFSCSVSGYGKTAQTEGVTILGDDPQTDVRRTPEAAVAALDVMPGLEATLFASEPMIANPSTVAVDHRGRLWVGDVVNYRLFNNKHSIREAGDRILVLADNNNDGQADQRTVFYESRDIDSIHGICVLPTPTGNGTKVIASAGTNVFVLHDTDGDDRADRKEVLFSGIEGAQHDHGIHAFVFGPDGKLYFNMGNMGGRIKDGDGNPIIDIAGNQVAVGRQPYQQGLVFRCNMDGSEFETLAWNFRNNWEVCVDSQGTLWQSDNDDDGNRSVRINYVMEFGNYGFRDELTGAAWKANRTGQADDIPNRHWHQNDPGVIPNMLLTGQGAPTGICVYEGSLLPKAFHNQLIHSDAGANIVRCYPVAHDGAGYTAQSLDVVCGTRDNWFRPTDVCIAPDGSLMISDWYDPGVGGHRMGDVQRGRIFRIAPLGHAYSVPNINLSSVSGALDALSSCNQSVRYMAWKKLSNAGSDAEEQLLRMFTNSDNPRQQMRALWLLGNIEGRGEHYVNHAINHPDPNMRVVGLRMASQLKINRAPLVRQLVDDESSTVRRQCAILLRGCQSSAAPRLWAMLAKRYDGHDRWYLEALGIGAEGQWNRYLRAWLAGRSEPINTPISRHIVWRSRAETTAQLLVGIILDAATPETELPRYFRALDFQSHNLDSQLQRLTSITLTDASRDRFIVKEAVKRIVQFRDLNRLNKILDVIEDDPLLLTLVERHDIVKRYPQLLRIAQADPQGDLGVAAIRILLGKEQSVLIADAIRASDLTMSLATLKVLGNSADGRIVKLLLPIIRGRDNDIELRRQATHAISRTTPGAKTLLEMAKSGQLDDELRSAAAIPLNSSPLVEVRSAAARLFPLPQAKGSPLPPLNQLLALTGNLETGQVVFAKTGQCANCHQVNGEGRKIGPELSAIGNKLSRQALYEAILYPNAGINHGYETYVVYLDSGNVLNGLLASEDAASVTIISADGITRQLNRSEIEAINKLNTSLMPADLQQTMSVEELVDVVEYLISLTKN